MTDSGCLCWSYFFWFLSFVFSNLVGKWRDSFLVERGKMTTIRFDKMHNVKSNEGLPLGDLDTDQGKTILAKKRLNKQARLAIECLKPKFQDPCLPHQKHKCVAKRNGGWKFKKCRPSIDPRRRFPPIKLPACHCIPGDEFGWRKPLGESESEFQARIDQWYGPHDSDNETELWKVDRNLLRRHQGSGGNNRRERKLIKQQQKFLASFAGWKDRPRRKGGRRHHERWRRDLDFEEAETNDTSTEMFVADSTTTTTTTTSSPMVPVTFASPDLSSIVVVEEEAPLEMVLDEIAQDEIQEVDIIMEDISDEIKDLQVGLHAYFDVLKSLTLTQFREKLHWQLPKVPQSLREREVDHCMWICIHLDRKHDPHSETLDPCPSSGTHRVVALGQWFLALLRAPFWPFGTLGNKLLGLTSLSQLEEVSLHEWWFFVLLLNRSLAIHQRLGKFIGFQLARGTTMSSHGWPWSQL